MVLKTETKEEQLFVMYNAFKVIFNTINRYVTKKNISKLKGFLEQRGDYIKTILVLLKDVGVNYDELVYRMMQGYQNFNNRELKLLSCKKPDYDAFLNIWIEENNEKGEFTKDMKSNLEDFFMKFKR